MSLSPQTPLRVVLVDFDWQDAEFMLRIVSRPETEIRLVLGATKDSAAIRLAELGRLPCSTDLGDLTREMFDLALISDRSPRSAHVEALLTVLGTPSRSPERFLREGEPTGARERASRHLVARALALEGELSGQDPFATLAPSPPEPPKSPEPAPVLENPPPPGMAPDRESTSPSQERADLGHLVHALANHTGARHAELRLGDSDSLDTVVQFGERDSLAEVLAGMALREGTEQVIRVLHGGEESRCWGAWPIRTPRCQALVCASGMKTDQQWEVWRDLAERLQERWNEPVRGRGEPPGRPRARGPWQPIDQFRHNLEAALEENRQQGSRFGLHCYRFAVPGPALEELFELLPRHLRGQDLLCRPDPQTLMVLTSGSPDTFFRLNQRILELWEGCWRMSPDSAADPRVDTESVELLSADGGLEFLARAARWLGARLETR